MNEKWAAVECNFQTLRGDKEPPNNSQSLKYYFSVTLVEAVFMALIAVISAVYTTLVHDLTATSEWRKKQFAFSGKWKFDLHENCGHLVEKVVRPVTFSILCFPESITVTRRTYYFTVVHFNEKDLDMFIWSVKTISNLWPTVMWVCSCTNRRKL